MSNQDIATIGIALDTDPVDKGVKSLETLAAQGPVVERSMKQIEGAADKAAKSVGGIGEKTGKSLASLGDGASLAAKKIDASTDTIADSLKNVGVQADVTKARTTQALDSVGISAKQTAAALRGVPAQFTDIVTSIAGGQAPLTVFLQQGGQLKDMFGGAGNAAKALGGYVVGLVNPYTLAAAAAVSLTAAYYTGSKEADEYRKAIILTGNAAGTTVGQMQQIARQIAEISGSQRDAAAALSTLASAGKVGSENLRQFALASVEFSRVTGKSIEDMAKDFAALANEPVKATLKLNESMNYLTDATYRQIKSLEEQGRQTDAANLAQKAYADTLSERKDDIIRNLGGIERAWSAIKKEANFAMDAFLDIGRSKTLETRLEKAQAALASFQSTAPGKRTTAQVAAVAEFGGEDGLKREIAGLQDLIENQRKSAEMEAERARNRKALFDFERQGDEFKTKAAKRDEEINKAEVEGRALILAGLLEEADLRKRIADIRKKYAETGAAGVGESEVAAIIARNNQAKDYLKRLRAQIAGEGALTADLKPSQNEELAAKIQQELATSITGVARAQKEKALAAALAGVQTDKDIQAAEKQKKSLIELQGLFDRQVDAARKQADSIQDQAIGQETVNANFGKSKTAIEQATLAQLKLQQAEAESSDRFAPAYVAAVGAKTAAQLRFVEALQAAEYQQSLQKLTEAGRAAQEETATLNLQLSLLGHSQVEREKIISQRQIEVRLAKELAEIDKLNLGEGPDADAKRLELRAKAAANAVVEANNAAAKVVLDDWQRTADDINRSLTDALLRGFESGKDFAQNLRDTIKNMFSTLVLRPVISAVMNPVAGVVGGAVNSALYGGAAQGVLGGVSGLASGANVLTGLQGTTGILGNIGTFLGTNAVATNTAIATSLGIDAASASAAATGASAAGGGGLAGLLSNPITMGLGAIAVLGLIGKATKGETRTGGQFGVAFDGSVTNQRRGQTYTIEGQQFDRDFTNGLQTALKDGIAYRLEGDPVAQEQAIRDAVSGTASGINGFLKALGSTATLTGFSAGLETSGKGRGGVFAGGMLSTGAGFGESGKGDNYAGTLYEKFSTNSPDFKTALENFTLDLKQSTIQALQTVSDIPEAVKKMLANVDSEGLTDDAANKLLETINSQIVGVNQLKDAFKGMGLDTLAALSFDAAAGLAEVSGGFDKLLGNLQTYYTNFFTGEEQRANLQRSLAEQLSTLGLQLPDINASNARDQFRALVSAAEKDMSESGRKTYATLLALSGAFASITEAAQTTTQTLEQQRQAYYGALQDAVSARNESLQSQLSAAQEVASTLDNLFGILRSNVRELYGEVDGTRGMLATQGNAFIDQALATAKASGYLPDADKLAEAIGAVRGGMYDRAYTTQFAADRDRLVLAGKLSGLQDIAGKQLTDAQKTVRALETQIDQNEQVLDYWKQQIDIASGTYEGVLSVTAAVDRLSASLGTTANTKPVTVSGGGGGGGGSVVGPDYRGSGTVPLAGYGADEALTSFDKFKAWYQGLSSNGNVAALQSDSYKVPDWMRVMRLAGDGTDKEMFGTYLNFKNNPQFAQDFQQIMMTGRSSMPTDGSTLVRSDLSKMPADVAEYFRANQNSLLSYEGFGLDPVLGYRLYKDGPGQFGLDIKRENFTEWLRTHKWTEGGIVEANNTLTYANAPYNGYKLPRWDTSSGNVVDLDGRIYTPDGKFLGTASREMMTTIYGAAFVGTTGGNYGDATRSALYNSQVQGGATEADYYGAIKSNLDSAIAGGMSAQGIADAIVQTGASMADVAAAYGITVAQLEENLRAGGATNIPKFAVGTNYVPKDMLAMIHEGEAVVPKAYNPAAGGGGAGSGRLELLVEQLIEKVAALEAAANETAGNTRLMPQMGRQFDQYSNGGQFSRQKVVA